MMSRNGKSRHRGSRWQVCLALAVAIGSTARAASPWDQPAAQLAAQIAEILGAGQAQLAVNNRSTIEAAQIPPIRRLLEQDLRARGIVVSGAESANLVRVTLSENARERLWIAEVIEGSRTEVTMVRADREVSSAPVAEAGLMLEKKRIWSSADGVSASGQPDSPVLAALETRTGLIILEQEQMIFFTRNAAAWHEEKRWNIGQARPLARDPHGLLLPASDGNGFLAVVPGRQCEGNQAASPGAGTQPAEWTVHCHESDDPWPVEQGTIESAAAGMHTFYNAQRNFFTGVIAPNPGVDAASFYSIAALPRLGAGNPSLLMGAVSGKVQLLEGNSLKAVSGARDWGSDFAVVRSACGAGTQVLASGSGEAQNDSLRAYELRGQEAVAVSAPLDMGGAVMALWSTAASDVPGVWAIVRKGTKEYEVNRVAAVCP